ncbi:hypothetical protein BN2497_8225 [Janthinobacterium sp. CG23_2]|nr:hypothetical protein BN2497_8225 [Janthinobacterium sp. CG23_2]CUU30510.1 hypothetical protein BN3177_8225 [Janthinobacterium sp. CG23_2]
MHGVLRIVVFTKWVPRVEVVPSLPVHGSNICYVIAIEKGFHSNFIAAIASVRVSLLANLARGAMARVRGGCVK